MIKKGESLRMPYNCTLTSENQELFENRILSLIELFFISFNTVLADCIITKMYEYLLAYQYINTDAEVHQAAGFKKMQLSVSGRPLVNLMSQIRNYEIHSPENLNEQLYTRFRSKITQESINDVTWFYLYPDLAVKFLEYQRDPATSGKHINDTPKKMDV